MRSAIRLWWLLRRRRGGDPEGLSEPLAVLAFGVTTAVMLVVIGGYTAFESRSVTQDDGEFYTFLAAVATLLLMVPLITLGGAAARLAVARRDARLAALRLAGATTSQVSALTVLDAGLQAIIGALAGVAGSFALVPLVRLVVFQDSPFGYAELLAPAAVYPSVVVGVTAIAVFSAGRSLRKLAITPLGVAEQHRTRPLHWSRLLPLVVVVLAYQILANSTDGSLIALAIVLVCGLAVLNLVGPWVMSIIGRLAVTRARTAATLLAARRLQDQPKTAWRSVGAIGLATFIAGLAAASAMLGGNGDPLVQDTTTGAMLTLVIAGVLAAVSTGVMQAGRILDQAPQYRALHLAGAGSDILQQARRREVAIPLLATMALSTAAAMVFILPVLGMTLLTSVPVVLQYAASIAVAGGLVMAGSAASGRLIRTVTR